MSRKAKYPIPIPQGVEIKVDNGRVTIKGPKGTLTHDLPSYIELEMKDQTVLVNCVSKKNGEKERHGLYRAIIDNMVIGTSKGFEKKLELVGVGYRAKVKGENLALQVGYSHPVEHAIPEGLAVKTEEKDTKILIGGIDKAKVGQFAAEIRSMRPPEPYKGKGIRYAGERIRRKAGKSAAKK